MTDEERLHQIAEWLEVDWTSDQTASLLRYQDWLLEEAMVAGGIGPAEAPRLFDRHIADSLVFLGLMGAETSTLIDVGSGVGLPAIPIAIVRPDIAVAIVDRSERRTRLARRALRILGLQNVDVRTADVSGVNDTFDVVTFRAALRLEPATAAFQRLAAEGGTGIYAWSRREQPKSPPEAPLGTIFSLVSKGSHLLDSPAWFLRMQRNRST